MINAFVATPILVEAGDRVPFAGHRAQTRSSCRCNGGWLTHEDGSTVFLISRPGVYMIGVGAQVTSAVAATVATIALTVNGEELAGTEMASTLTTAGDIAQLATTALLTVPCGASVTVGLANTGDADITVNEASLVLTRIA